jgi:hypothetical protein
MPFYRCLKCHKEFKKPYLLERHNNRKNPCDLINKPYNIKDNNINDENNETILNDDKSINEKIKILFNMVNDLKKENENII